jgi:hypothetical protein
MLGSSHVAGAQDVKDFTKPRVKAETKFYSFLQGRKGARHHRQHKPCCVTDLSF